MITELLVSGVFDLMNKIISVPNVVLSDSLFAFLDNMAIIVRFAWCVLPMDTFISILGLTVALQAFRIFVAIFRFTIEAIS